MADIEFLHKHGVLMGDLAYDRENRYAYLGRLIVSPKRMRRQGVGRELHSLFEHEALLWGNLAIITLLNPDRKADLEATHNFLIKIGYSLFEYKNDEVYRKVIQKS